MRRLRVHAHDGIRRRDSAAGCSSCPRRATTIYHPLSTIHRSGMIADYIMVGGFLGAGKTTALLRLAEYLTARGRRVGLITNDQSSGLVDTALVDARGYPVQEITGGCFC